MAPDPYTRFFKKQVQGSGAIYLIKVFYCGVRGKGCEERTCSPLNTSSLISSLYIYPASRQTHCN